MREGFKSVLWIALIGAGLVGLIAWFGSGSGLRSIPTSMWLTRIAAMLVFAAAAGALVWGRFRADLAPDYLRQISRKILECQGICFAVIPEEVDGRCEMHVYVQNRFDRSANIVLSLTDRPNFSISRSQHANVLLSLHCPGSGFVLARLPMGLPRKMQGKRRRFEVEAKVAYPAGCGTMVRFRPGRRLAAPTDVGAATLATVLLGPVFLILALAASKPSITLRLPKGVGETLDPSTRPTTEVLWEPGDEVVDLARSSAEPKVDFMRDHHEVAA